MAPIYKIALMFAVIAISVTGYAGTFSASSGPPANSKHTYLAYTQVEAPFIAPAIVTGTTVPMFDGTGSNSTVSSIEPIKASSGQAAIYFGLRHPRIPWPRLELNYDFNYWKEQIRPLIPANAGTGRNKKYNFIS